MSEQAGHGPRIGIRRHIVSQFGNPRGWLGWLAGRMMAGRPSNRLRNAWTVDLMRLERAHRVLEVGYGPGLALEAACRRVTGGLVAGIDRSPLMHGMAAARNRPAVRTGRMVLAVGDIEDGVVALPGSHFDRIFAVNVALFWRDPAAVLARLAGHLAPDGGIYLTHQPRAGDRSDAAALAMGDKLAAAMRAAGLRDVRIERLDTISPIAVSVIGQGRPASLTR